MTVKTEAGLYMEYCRFKQKSELLWLIRSGENPAGFFSVVYYFGC